MDKKNTKKKYIVVCLILLIFTATYIVYDHFKTVACNNTRNEIILQVVFADPDASTISKNGVNITNKFIAKYLPDIKNGDFSKAIKEIREKEYSISISESTKNRDIYKKLLNTPWFKTLNIISWLFSQLIIFLFHTSSYIPSYSPYIITYIV